MKFSEKALRLLQPSSTFVEVGTCGVLAVSESRRKILMKPETQKSSERGR